MESTVEYVSPTRVRLAIQVAANEPCANGRAEEATTARMAMGKLSFACGDRTNSDGMLSEAMSEVISASLYLAVREHDLALMGYPEVEIGESGDGRPLEFTAVADVRPAINLPDLSCISVEVQPVNVSEADIDELFDQVRRQLAAVTEVDRPAQVGDVVTMSLHATVDAEEIAQGRAAGVFHQVGSGHLLLGLDDGLFGMSAGESTAVRTRLVGGEHAGRDADLEIEVSAVMEVQLPDPKDVPAAVAHGSLEELRDRLREQLTFARKGEQLVEARNRVLKAVVDAAEIVAPESIVRGEAALRKESLIFELEKARVSLADCLAAEESTEDEVDSEILEAAKDHVRAQLLLDALADAEQISLTEEEFAQGVMQRAERLRRPPQAFYNELVENRMIGAVHADLRRGKALALVMDRVTVTDTDRTIIDFSDIREPYDGQNRDLPLTAG
jgi:trigger factor